MKKYLFGVLIAFTMFLITPTIAKAAPYIYFNTQGGTTTTGTTNNTINVERNDTVYLDNYVTTRNGYNFAGWCGDNYPGFLDIPRYQCPITNNIFYVPWWVFNPFDLNNREFELKAQWKLATYNINYDLAGGSYRGGINPNPRTYTYESRPITLVNPARNGFDFTGWTGTGLTGPTINVTISSGSYGNRSYTATWREQTNKLTFVTNGGTVTTNTVNNVLEKPKSTTISGSEWNNYTTSKPGYNFEGWYDSTLSNKVTSFSFANSGSVYAKYSVIPYTISYDGLDGATVSPANPTGYNIESADIRLNNPTKKGHRFLGWTGTGLTTPTTNVTIKNGSMGDRNYKANWELEDYTLDFETNGGSPVAPITDKYGTVIDLSQISTSRNGYNFEGWFKDSSFVNQVNSIKLEDNTKVYAKWQFIYKILAGNNQTHVKVIDKDLIIVSNGDANNLLHITVNGKILPLANYEIRSGSTILTLKKKYLDSLAVGNYVVAFVYNDGSVSTNFKVVQLNNNNNKNINNNKSNKNGINNGSFIENPNTSDNIMVYVMSLLVSVISLGFLSRRFVNNK